MGGVIASVAAPVIGNAIFGGGSGGTYGQGGSTGSQSYGYQALPPAMQQIYNTMAQQANGTLLSNPQKAAQMYTPTSIANNPYETQAIGMMTPNAGQIAQNYMNPYANSILQNIAQQYGAKNSMYNDELSGSGWASGTTNRDFLNKGYMQGQEQLAMGNAMAGEYQNALNSGLEQNALSVQNLMGAGTLQRNLGLQTAQAPVSALQALGNTMNLVPSGGQGTNTYTNNAMPNMAALSSSIQGGMGNLFGGIGNLFGGGSSSGGLYGGGSSWSPSFGTINWY